MLVTIILVLLENLQQQAAVLKAAELREFQMALTALIIMELEVEGKTAALYLLAVTFRLRQEQVLLLPTEHPQFMA